MVLVFLVPSRAARDPVGCAFCLPFLVVPRIPFAEVPLVSVQGCCFVAPLAAACAPHLGAGLPFLLVSLSLPPVLLGSLACLLHELKLEALPEARSGIISAVTYSSCILLSEGYHRGQKSCGPLCSCLAGDQG